MLGTFMLDIEDTGGGNSKPGRLEFLHDIVSDLCGQEQVQRASLNNCLTPRWFTTKQNIIRSRRVKKAGRRSRRP